MHVVAISEWIDELFDKATLMGLLADMLSFKDRDEIVKALTSSKICKLFLQWQTMQVIDRNAARKAVKPCPYELYYNLRTPKFMRGYCGVRYCTDILNFVVKNNQYEMY